MKAKVLRVDRSNGAVRYDIEVGGVVKRGVPARALTGPPKPQPALEAAHSAFALAAKTRERQIAEESRKAAMAEAQAGFAPMVASALAEARAQARAEFAPILAAALSEASTRAAESMGAVVSRLEGVVIASATATRAGADAMQANGQAMRALDAAVRAPVSVAIVRGEGGQIAGLVTKREG